MSEFERNLAVVTGINGYQNGIYKLNSAVTDVVAIASILQNTYKYDLFHPDVDSGVVIHQYATNAKLKEVFTDILPNRIKPTERDRFTLQYFYASCNM